MINVSASASAEHDELTAMMIEQGLMPAPKTIGEPDEIVVGEDEIVTASGNDAIDAELDAALAELSLEVTPEIEVAPEGSADISEEVLAGIVGELEAEEARHAAYNEQETSVEGETPEVEGEVPVKAVKASRAAPAAPRTSRLAGATHGAYVAAKLDDAAIAAAVDGLPKKVKDKATNLVDHIKGGKPLSVYTLIAVNMLRTDGVMTTPKLVDALVGASKKSAIGVGYSIGTARSQAGQMISLFGKLGIAKPDGAKGLVPDADNAIWQALAA